MMKRLKNRIKLGLSPLMYVLGPLIATDSLQRIRVYGKRDRVRIASTAMVNDATFNVVSGEIVIEDHVFFGQSVCLYTGTHDMTKFDEERKFASPTSGRDIIVKRGAWIASNAIILGPCVIGEHAVVGAASLVTKDVPHYTLVAGNPARVIRDVRSVKPDNNKNQGTPEAEESAK